MVTELIGKEIIAEIAKQLGKPVTYIYQVMVKAQPIQAMICLSCLLLYLFALGISIKIAYDKSQGWDLESKVMLFIVIALFALIGLLILNIITTILTMIILPEYSAIIAIARIIG